MPIYRIGEGKYLIGTESKMCLIKGTSCVVRVGGGFLSLEEYLNRNQAVEVEKITKMMLDQNKTYLDVIKDLLVKYNTETAIMNQVIKSLQLQAVNYALK